MEQGFLTLTLRIPFSLTSISYLPNSPLSHMELDKAHGPTRSIIVRVTVKGMQRFVDVCLLDLHLFSCLGCVSLACMMSRREVGTVVSALCHVRQMNCLRSLIVRP